MLKKDDWLLKRTRDIDKQNKNDVPYVDCIHFMRNLIKDVKVLKTPDKNKNGGLMVPYNHNNTDSTKININNYLSINNYIVTLSGDNKKTIVNLKAKKQYLENNQIAKEDVNKVWVSMYSDYQLLAKNKHIFDDCISQITETIKSKTELCDLLPDGKIDLQQEIDKLSHILKKIEPLQFDFEIPEMLNWNSDYKSGDLHSNKYN